MRERPTARVLLIDPDKRLLLQRIVDPSISELGQPPIDELWCPVGGGVDDHETYEDAARREVWEETGITDVHLGPWVWSRNLTMHWKGEKVLFPERFFLAWSHTAEISLENLEDAERQTIKEFRWWEPQALLEAQSSTIFKPDVIPSGLNAILKEGPPSEPMPVT